jgi:hypothetical protein
MPITRSQPSFPSRSERFHGRHRSRTGPPWITRVRDVCLSADWCHRGALLVLETVEQVEHVSDVGGVGAQTERPRLVEVACRRTRGCQAPPDESVHRLAEPETLVTTQSIDLCRYVVVQPEPCSHVVRIRLMLERRRATPSLVLSPRSLWFAFLVGSCGMFSTS